MCNKNIENFIWDNLISGKLEVNINANRLYFGDIQIRWGFKGDKYLIWKPRVAMSKLVDSMKS